MTELEEFRAEKDRFFASHPQSPLTREQKKDFKGLNYFPENSDLRFDVTVEPYPEQEMIEMQTSTGGIQEYIRFGKFKFEVDGQVAELTIYVSEHDYFLPFADSLAGTETYGAGRYLEPEPIGSGRFYIDFNLAYNPYCAYNEPYEINPNAVQRWSCPLTPKENRLSIPILAGEKVYYPEH